MTILIVEDESLVSLEIASFIDSLSYSHLIANNAYDAIQKAKEFSPDLVLMDINLHDKIDGIECASEIKQFLDTQVIYITAFYDDDTIERALLTHPAAYLTKPFNRNELKASIKIALSNYELEIQVGDIKLDSKFSYDSLNKLLYFNQEEIHLTKRERELLDLLIRAKQNVVSIYDIENVIWPNKEANENTRRSLIGRLRAKLNHKFIKTIPSLGYKIEF